ncbi:MAG: methyltransferase [Planctomycetota bacterium]
MKLDPRLPDLAGGWTRQSHLVAEDLTVELFVPAAPDELLDDEAVIERNEFNDSMPYWAWLWDSAPAMARRVAAAPLPAGARVLELGAGLGLVGIAAARAARGPVELALTDHDPLSLAVLPLNADLNGLGGVRVWNLDWRELERAEEGEFDLILGCDVAYEARLQDPLLDVLERYQAADGVALFADPGRTRLPGFLRRARARGLAVAVEDGEGRPAEPAAGALRFVAIARDPEILSGRR